MTFDARGNAVWEWQVKTGVYDRELETARLERIRSGLEIAEDPLSTQKRRRKIAENERERGFDPYNASIAGAPPSPPSDDPQRQAPKDQPRQPPRRGFFARLFGRRG